MNTTTNTTPATSPASDKNERMLGFKVLKGSALEVAIDDAAGDLDISVAKLLQRAVESFLKTHAENEAKIERY